MAYSRVFMQIKELITDESLFTSITLFRLKEPLEPGEIVFFKNYISTPKFSAVNNISLYHRFKHPEE